MHTLYDQKPQTNNYFGIENIHVIGRYTGNMNCFQFIYVRNVLIHSIFELYNPRYNISMQFNCLVLIEIIALLYANICFGLLHRFMRSHETVY